MRHDFLDEWRRTVHRKGRMPQSQKTKMMKKNPSCGVFRKTGFMSDDLIIRVRCRRLVEESLDSLVKLVE